MGQSTPGQLVWIRFKKNRLALASLWLIGLSLFVAAFCYFIIPDGTPDANRMCLPINNRPPGFSVQMILLKKNTPSEQVNWWNQMLYGEKDQYDAVAVTDVMVMGDSVSYTPYSDGSVKFPLLKISLADAVWSLSDPSKVVVEGSAIRSIGTDGQTLQQSREKLAATFCEQQVVQRSFRLGTDRYGRDMLSRLLVGTRITFLVGLVAVVISLFVGVVLGGLAGYFRGKMDQFILWLINVIWSIPTLLLVIAITLVLGKGFTQVFVAVGLTMWVDVARIVRSQLFAVRELDFVAAGRTMGFSDSRILFRHMLPNVVGPVLVVAASNFSTAILLEAGLSFLGIGAQPPTPSWGAMIKENYGFIILPDSAYLAILPGFAILLLTLAFTFVANGLRDAMDSRKQLLGG